MSGGATDIAHALADPDLAISATGENGYVYNNGQIISTGDFTRNDGYGVGIGIVAAGKSNTTGNPDEPFEVTAFYDGDSTTSVTSYDGPYAMFNSYYSYGSTSTDYAQIASETEACRASAI